MRIVILSVIVLGASSPFSAASLRALTIEERVAGQRAIEEAYARHLDGPPSSSVAVPDAVVRAKVERFLRESAALDRQWNTRIDSDAVARELARMAKQSLRPDILSDLFRALDSDPNKVAELLVRPIIADRLARSSYAWDPSIHGALRRQAEQSLRVSKSLDALSRTAPRWETREVDPGTDDARPTAKVEETETSFVVRGVVSRDRDKVVVGTATWDKEPFETWLDRTQALEPPAPLGAAASLPALGGGCTADRWDDLPSPPDPMVDTVYAWTGTEMIAWSPRLRVGGRYDAASDQWTLLNPAGTTARSGATAVWAGNQLVVWGGTLAGSSSTYLDTGERYDPVTDTWSPTSTAGAPAGRIGHVAVWTGSRMIVQGGVALSGVLTSGGSYDPATDTWASISSTNAPTGRTFATAVWDGARVLVWGGTDAASQPIGTGARYEPSTDTWTPISTSGAPSARRQHTAVWTGSAMVVWGGRELSNIVNTGARYDPVADTWTPTTTSSAPPGAFQHTAVWTGTEMIVWGGFTYSGGRYNPATDSWGGIAGPNIPTIGHHGHAMVWTGSKVIVWGGAEAAPVNTGGRYDPASNSWAPTLAYGNPSPRDLAALVWTGTDLLVWGGTNETSTFPSTHARLNLATGTWSPISPTGAPQARCSHTMIWTGSKAIVWGGRTGGVNSSAVNTGGLYDPASDSWASVSTTGAPTARFNHSAVWTGKRMVIWGGFHPTLSIQVGGLYDPTTNTWTATSTTNAPTASSTSTLVWTGSWVVAWWQGANPSSRLDPETNTWNPVNPIGQPASASLTAWTGSRMIAWSPGATGGLYDPDTNTWTAMSTSGAPTAGTSLTWTGDRALAWSDAGTGAFYDPAANAWSVAPVSGAPSARGLYSAVWTGTSVTLWGGKYMANMFAGSGAALCQACATTFTYYRDQDGDHDGVPGETVEGCFATAPFGWSTSDTDCNDTSPAVYAGAPQLCDGINNDCSDPHWPTVPSIEANADGDGFRICQGDCNDASTTVYPGAPQICDGVNNDCSDASWPTPPAVEADADGDGYRVCANDCNDGNPLINPGRIEICDGLDNDCSGAFDDDVDGVDVDADGVHNVCDNCKFVGNAAQVDADLDALGDACDNCPSMPNATQSDRNADGQGDLCDLDDGVIYLFSTHRDEVEWQQEVGPSAFNVYEGDLAVLRLTGEYSQAPGSNPLAQRTCSVAGGSVSDTESLESGQVKFSIVTGVTGGLEGTMGTNSAGTPRSNTNPCP